MLLNNEIEMFIVFLCLIVAIAEVVRLLKTPLDVFKVPNLCKKFLYLTEREVSKKQERKEYMISLFLFILLCTFVLCLFIQEKWFKSLHSDLSPIKVFLLIILGFLMVLTISELSRIFITPRGDYSIPKIVQTLILLDEEEGRTLADSKKNIYRHYLFIAGLYILLLIQFVLYFF